ncbi:MAG TPA: diguanylate cyclase [Luteimonas sp.]
MTAISRLQPIRYAAAVVALLLLVAVAAVLVFGVRQLTESNRWVEHSHRVIEELEAGQSLMAAAQAAGRGYRLSGHPSLRSEFDRTGPQALAVGRELVRLTVDNPRQHARAKQLLEQNSGQLRRMQELADIQDRDGREAAIGAMRVDELVRRMHGVNVLVEDLREEERALLAERRSASARRIDMLLGFVLLSLAVSLATFWMLLVSLSRENRRNRRLEREARRSLEELRSAQALGERLSAQRALLGEYTSMLQSVQNLDEAMELTTGTLERLLPHAGGQYYLARASRDLLESRASFGQPAIASSDTLVPDECWALRRGQPHHNRAGGRARCAHMEHGTSLATVSTWCVPLSAQGETLGMLHASGPADTATDGNDTAIIESMGEQLALAIANLRLRETLRQQSLRDPLTGLFNRRYFEESLRREMLRCERRHLPLSLLVIDIDHFKNFNDTQGHSAGDAVLAHVGHCIGSLVRAEDMACRYGGEEFTVVMPETDAAAAVMRAESIRREVSQQTISHNGRTLGPVTVSIGVATFPPDGVTPELLFEVADASLYRAKAEGRNRVLHASAAD